MNDLSLAQAVDVFLDHGGSTSDPELRAVIMALLIEDLADVVLTDDEISDLPIDDREALIRLVRSVRSF